MESLLKNLKKHAKCSICLDTFTEPKTIACLHTFCCECLKKHALLSQRGGQFRCPECQAQIGIPEANRFDQLPTSFHHRSLLSLLAAHDERANILAGVELMKQKSEVCNDLIRQFEEIIIKLEINIIAAKRQVSQTAEQMIAAIQEREREAITTLENTRVSRMKNLDAVKKQVEMLAKQIKQAAEFANDLVQRSSSADLMQNKRNLEERFEDLGNTALPALPAGPFVKFVSTCTPDNASLGFIKLRETDPNRSSMEGLDQNFQAGVEAEISIFPKTYEGQISNTQHEDHVEVLVEPIDQLASLMINEESGGNFQVKFVPKLPGAYHISTKINGENLAQSPFTIEVKERRLEVVGELVLQNETLEGPSGIAVNSKGLIAIGDRVKHCILIFNKEGKYVRQLGCYGNIRGELNFPDGVTFINDDEILVADECQQNQIQMFNFHNGNFVKSFGKEGRGDGEFKNPSGVCMDGKGNMVVAEYSNDRIQVLTKDGAPVLKFGDSGPEKLNGPVGCVYYKNMFIVTDSKNGCLKLFDSSGKFLRKIGDKGKADGQFTQPWGLCVDKHGNILVGDVTSGHVQQFTIEGRFTGKTVANLQRPWGITTMPDGRILISDNWAKKVFMLK